MLRKVVTVTLGQEDTQNGVPEVRWAALKKWPRAAEGAREGNERRPWRGLSGKALGEPRSAPAAWPPGESPCVAAPTTSSRASRAQSSPACGSPVLVALATTRSSSGWALSCVCLWQMYGADFLTENEHTLMSVVPSRQSPR